MYENDGQYREASHSVKRPRSPGVIVCTLAYCIGFGWIDFDVEKESGMLILVDEN